MFLITKKIKKITYLFIFSFLVFFNVSYAASGDTFKTLIQKILNIFNSIVGLIMAFATLYFLYGILRYLIQYYDQKARVESIKVISYGLIALFVMVAVWGIVAVLNYSLFGVQGIRIPQF
jgi:fumarate reductase subunit D